MSSNRQQECGLKDYLCFFSFTNDVTVHNEVHHLHNDICRQGQGVCSSQPRRLTLFFRHLGS